MNDILRTALIVFFACLLLSGSVGYVRIADVHFGSKETIGENPTPQERIEFGLADLSRTNYHVERTRVSTNRTSGDVWAQGYQVQRVNHNSEQIYLSTHYREFDSEFLYYHYAAKDQSWRTSVDDSEWQLTPPSNTEWDRRGDKYLSSDYRIPLNASAEWRVTGQTDETVVVGVDSVEAYRHAFDISRQYRTTSNGDVSVHLDRETGVIQKVVITEVAMVDSSHRENRVPSKLRAVYEYDRSGDVSITPPEPADPPSFEALAYDFIVY